MLSVCWNHCSQPEGGGVIGEMLDGSSAGAWLSVVVGQHCVKSTRSASATTSQMSQQVGPPQVAPPSVLYQPPLSICPKYRPVWFPASGAPAKSYSHVSWRPTIARTHVGAQSSER